MRMVSIALLLCLLPSFAEAGPFRRWRRCSTATVRTVHRSFSGTASQVAIQKATYAARNGIKGHLGGSFGGCRYEGVGFSTYSAASALNACCYTGQRRCAASAVVRGADGFYAVKLFH